QREVARTAHEAHQGGHREVQRRVDVGREAQRGRAVQVVPATQLRDVVDHPALDPLELVRITEPEQRDDDVHDDEPGGDRRDDETRVRRPQTRLVDDDDVVVDRRELARPFVGEKGHGTAASDVVVTYVSATSSMIDTVSTDM